MNYDHLENSCDWFLQNMDAYIDQELCDEDSERMLAHAKMCPACSAQLMFSAKIRDEMLGMDDAIAVPLAAQSAWRLAVRAERRQKRSRGVIRAVSGLAAAFLVLVGTTVFMRAGGYLSVDSDATNLDAARTYVAGETASEKARYIEPAGGANESMPVSASYDMMTLEMDGEIPDNEPVNTVSPTAGAESKAAAKVKLVQSMRMEIETLEFDTAYDTISDLALEYDGYFSQKTVDTQAFGGRLATIIVRVPTELMDGFAEAVNHVGAVIASERFAQDVSGYYYDAQSRLDAQKLIAQRLVSLIDDAGADQIESLNAQLMAAYDQIDELEQTLRTYNNDQLYSEVSITLQEVSSLPAPSPEPSLGERSKSGIQQSLTSIGAFFEDMVVSLVIIAPMALIVLAGCALIALTVYLIKKKKKQKVSQKNEDERDE